MTRVRGLRTFAVGVGSIMLLAALGCGGGGSEESTAAQTAAEETQPVVAESGASDPAEIPDAVSAAPEVYVTLFEDDRARVVEMELGAGASDNLHRHPHEVVYFLAGGKVRIDLPEGEPLEVELPDGAVLSHEPWAHKVTNTGDTDLHAILVELQQEPGDRAEVVEGTDAVTVAPTVYTDLFDDERARVLEMKLAAGATDGEHSHPDEVAYFIRGGKLRITVDGEAMEVELPDGAVLSHEGWTHTVENIGTTDIHAVIWELK